MEAAPPTMKILVIGRTGNGKSTVCNVITNTTRFHESAMSVSDTKKHQVEITYFDGNNWTVVDTIGIGDTKSTIQQVLYMIADACYSVRDGLNQILFVTTGRFSEEEIQAYNLLRSVIFNNEIVRYTTIVRTRFPKFRDPAKCEEDVQLMLNENAELANVIRSCNKVIHVNNLTEDEDPALNCRKDSRLKLMLHLRGCNQIYKPKELDDLNERIRNHMTEKELLEKKIAEIQKQLDEGKNANAELQKELERQREQTNAQLEEAYRRVAQTTGATIRERSPGVWEIITGWMSKAVKRCSIQ